MSDIKTEIMRRQNMIEQAQSIRNALNLFIENLIDQNVRDLSNLSLADRIEIGRSSRSVPSKNGGCGCTSIDRSHCREADCAFTSQLTSNK